MTARQFRGRHSTAKSGHLISVTVALLAVVLAAPSQGQTDCPGNLAEHISNPARLTVSYAVLPIAAQQFNGAIFELAASHDSPLCAQQEQQSQQEEVFRAGSVVSGGPKINDEDATNQSAQPNAQRGTSNDRLFKVLPNFLTLENAGQLPPLTTGEKFKVVARGTFDFVQIPWYGLLAGLSQAQNSEPGYGQGAAGYGKRYGAYVADGTIENFMVGAVLPSLLHQDPRFYQSSNGGFLHRLGYAASRIVIGRTDSGAAELNYSEIFGSAMSAGISTYSYHPHADRTLPNTVSVWGSQVGYDTVSLVIKEFWPDIRKKISHKRSAEATSL